MLVVYLLDTAFEWSHSNFINHSFQSLASLKWRSVKWQPLAQKILLWLNQWLEAFLRKCIVCERKCIRFLSVQYEIWSGDWVCIQIQKQASYLTWVTDWGKPSHWTIIISLTLSLWQVCHADSQVLTNVRGFICSVILLFFFFLQRCPLSQLVLRVKLFDIGPPKAILNLALQPPDTDDIERTILLLKQVWDWFHHTILLGLPVILLYHISGRSCRLVCPDLSTRSIVIFHEVGRVLREASSVCAKLVDMGFSQAAYVNKLYRHGLLFQRPTKHHGKQVTLLTATNPEFVCSKGTDLYMYSTAEKIYTV